MASTEVQDLIDYLEESPSMFHAVAAARRRLDAAGYTYLPEQAAWEQRAGGRYYTQRNGSSLIAWQVGEGVAADVATAPGAAASAAPYHFQLTASHSDSPAFKVKSAAELAGPGDTLRLNVEAYGGMIDYTWFDRPLGISGRVMVRDAAGTRVESRLLHIDRPVAIIPSLAIHMDRGVNAGFSPNRQVDLCPLVALGAEVGTDATAGWLDDLVATELGVESSQILARDVFLTSLQAPIAWGGTAEVPEFVSAGQLDDLMCAYTALAAFISTAPAPGSVNVYCLFDNEEVGSNTKQGAMSTLLRDTLERVNAGLSRTAGDLRRALAASILVSCDNAHAVHPNHPEKADELARPRLGGGIVVKEAANQHYCTDAFSRAALTAVLDRAGVPWQTFANRSDMAGGSTLGNLSNMQVSMHAVDVGLPQLSMHSSFETAAAADVAHGIEALRAFYAADLRIEGAEAVTLG